ncbi:PREDICTED: pentatricopeptide repeat-containing protein At3g62890-like [Nicotiana attenuata]|uniref:Pentatricopeptide repeat-containing protein, chloroplastic n=1 Tax=Nicotiana attenuata TaxID=49451 RepID=A0A314KLW0_NICAT|nr:PREDICTED: pentatricopeptide repeat-containing protein At3g62890-like [Nicotiana attenuata]OIT30326.1 pentatricopeptide repeat-containing protein, chloroplastic [Nicotiana attenuata]
MNLTKVCAFSPFKSNLVQKPTSKTTINLSILEVLMLKCQNSKHFGQILSQMISTGFIKDTYAASRILKFSTDSLFIHVNYSHKIFDYIENPNGFIRNTMMRAYLQQNQPQNTILLYKSMLKNNVCIDNYTFPLLVQASTVRLSEIEGKEFHNHVIKTGFTSDVYVKNTLINMYAVCENMVDARKLFDESPVLDSISWNSILAGYVQVGNVEEAKVIFDKMPMKNVIASNSMIVLLGRSGRMTEACQLLDEMKEKDVVSWTALISCYEQHGMYKQALDLFMQMCANGTSIDEVVVISVLSACAHLLVVQTGESVHGLVIRVGFESYVNLQNALIHMYSTCGDVTAAQRLFDTSSHLDQISWNSMISGYLKCGSLEKARELFDCMPEKDVVSWTTMISGYAQHDYFSETLALFQEMLHADNKPDETTLVSVLSACTHLSALDQGKWIHAYIRKNGLKVNIILGTTLVDMYLKCGCVENALEVFNGMEEKGVSSWNALILGLAMNGQVEKSLAVFQEMKECGVTPNEVTFVAVLGACRHMGLVEEGRSYFDSMTRYYSVEPNIKHYGCMVDLLGRAGLLKEAETLIDSMPMAPDVATWGALLGACRKHGNSEMGERVGRKLIELQPDHDGFHVLLSNIFASKGNWDSVLDIRGAMMRQGVVKVPGCSMIEANGAIHEFLAGDKSHLQINEIETMLAEMEKRLKIMGYAPGTDEVLLDIDEEEKESTLFRHSEKLAIAYGLISITPPTPIRIIKNLRICSDCHTAAKLISKAFNREIVVRDRHRFHHFKDGSCSCMEFW